MAASHFILFRHRSLKSLDHPAREPSLRQRLSKPTNDPDQLQVFGDNVAKQGLMEQDMAKSNMIHSLDCYFGLSRPWANPPT